MKDGIEDFKSLMRRLDRYGGHVTRAIRRRFRTRKMRVLYGTEDCMQSVWGSIFSDIDRVAKIDTPEHLMQYLAKVAGNKLIDRDRKQRAQCNDIYRECDLPESAVNGQNGLLSSDLTPSQAVAIDDEWNVRTKGLPTEKRTILELHRQGHTSDEIAAKTDRSSRGIRRVIQQLREMFGNDSDADAKRSDRRKPSEGDSNRDATR